MWYIAYVYFIEGVEDDYGELVSLQYKTDSHREAMDFIKEYEEMGVVKKSRIEKYDEEPILE